MRTVGVEEELLLLDADSGTASAAATVVLAPLVSAQASAAASKQASGPGGTVEAELQQQQLEVDTPPLQELTELAAAIRAGRARADSLARRRDTRIAALATAPSPVTPQRTDKARYRAMASHYGLTAAEQLTSGVHVHVEIDSVQEGVAVLNRIRVWLPVLLALSANSPYWHGVDTGYASYRYQAWGRLPSTGPTPTFGSAEHYREVVDGLVSSGVLLDHAMVYFDARLSQRYPTVEVRVADVCLRADDAVLVAALARALVDTAAGHWHQHTPVPDVSTELIRLASWRASRSGLTDQLLDPFTARPRRAFDVVGSLLRHVEPALSAAGDLDLVQTLWADVRARGTGADAQRTWSREAGLERMALRAAEETLR